MFVGRPKDFKDAYLPQCALWIPESAEREQPVEVMGYAGRVYDDLEVTVQAFADLRTDWYAGEQKILALRDALWVAALKHIQLGATVATVTESDVVEGRGFCYESDRRRRVPLLRAGVARQAAVERSGRGDAMRHGNQGSYRDA